MRFRVNQELVKRARGVLYNRPRLYWVIGGACAGKSTVCRTLSAEYDLPVYDMDAHIFDDYPSRCTLERYPALKAWFTASDSFAWLLGLPEGEFEEFNKASTAEYLDLLADDLSSAGMDQPLLVDGGITNPALLVQVMPARQIACLKTAESTSVRSWEESADRRFMKEMVFRLPDPENAWRRFLRYDALITRTLLKECEENGIRIYARDEDNSVNALAEQIAGFRQLKRPPRAM